jgi:hypothetical protein
MAGTLGACPPLFVLAVIMPRISLMVIPATAGRSQVPGVVLANYAAVYAHPGFDCGVYATRMGWEAGESIVSSAVLKATAGILSFLVD